MSILIKGMEMPKSRPLVVVIDAAGQARRYDLNNDRYADKELFETVSIPPHGRLIDTDAVSLEGGPYEYDEWCKWALVQYQDAPTIIPAETTLENEIKIIDTKGKPNYDPKHRFVIPAEEGE